MEGETAAGAADMPSEAVGSAQPSIHVDRLSPELLAAIFECVHALGETTEMDSGKAISSDDRGMLDLSQVCKSWRQVRRVP